MNDKDLDQLITKQYDAFYTWLIRLNEDQKLGFDIDQFKCQLNQAIFASGDGHLEKWMKGFGDLPDISAQVDMYGDAVQIGDDQALSQNEIDRLKETLMRYHPWRKGPFRFWNIDLDTEWRSNMKWDRLIAGLPSLTGKRVLDVGSGNGYYGWRMACQSPEMIIGIDPSLLFIFQWLTVRRYVSQEIPNYLLPWTLESFPLKKLQFDIVFSMGVLYHRKSPFDHLSQLMNHLRSEGTLVLETMVVDGDATTCLVPQDRYAQMRNVWFIPSVEMLKQWLYRVGFREILVIDVNMTSIEEQRSTPWMKFDSLERFLNQENTKTIEGYQRPTRVIMTAQKM